MLENEIEINGEIYIKKECDKNIGDCEIKSFSCKEIAVNAFKKMGYEILTVVDGTANGPDMHIKKDNLVFRVEIKKARISKRSMAVHPVEENRKNDDLIAIVFPSGYILIEPMQDHLFSCSDSGSRSLFGIY